MRKCGSGRIPPSLPPPVTCFLFGTFHFLFSWLFPECLKLWDKNGTSPKLTWAVLQNDDAERHDVNRRQLSPSICLHKNKGEVLSHWNVVAKKTLGIHEMKYFCRTYKQSKIIYGEDWIYDFLVSYVSYKGWNSLPMINSIGRKWLQFCII